MKVKLTLVRPGGATADIAVTTEPTIPISDIAHELASADPTHVGSPFEPGALTLRVHGDGGSSRVVDPASALADAGVGSGAVVSLAPVSEQSERSGSVAATVTVLDGPDKGKTFPIPVGSSSVGRGQDQSIVLTDPLVSKSHVRINVTDVAEVIDLGSANGTTVNGETVDRATVAGGDIVGVGDTTFTVAVAAHRASAAQSGSEYFNRSPRLDPHYPGMKLASPEPPERGKPQRLPIIALIAPLVMGAILFAVTQSALSLIFIGLSPILMLATYIDNRVQNKRQWRIASADFAASMDSTTSTINSTHEVELASRLRETPSLRDVVADVQTRGPFVWTRRPEHAEFLTIRLGLGDVPSRVAFQLPSQRKGTTEHWELVKQAAELAAIVRGAPVVENLAKCGSIGVAGPLSNSRGVARGLVAQLAALHSPAELVIAGIASTDSAAQWDWLKWLPHVGSAFAPVAAAPLATGGQGTTALVSELEALVETRAEAQSSSSESGSELPIVLLVVEDDAPVERARLVSLAEHGPAVGIHLIWVSVSLARLPAACRTFIEVTGSADAALAGFVHTADGISPVSCETMDADAALQLSRSLAPLVDSGARLDDASDLPRSISLLQLLGNEIATDPDAVVGRWTETNSILTGRFASSSPGKSKPNLRAVFGQAASEPFAIDLRADGPHALVGGTTGSGKSEFLQAWVLGLAAAHSPQRVSFLFVDYKGGSAFANCIDLPHSVGIVTDLSEHMVRRALTSLRAELRYREHLFLRKKFKDILDFERSGDPDVPPSLVIVVDEFAALATEVPEFVDGVVDVAQRGRSLGLHLILATQRPAGVIRDNLRANTNLRIALRMADESDSDDVLGTPLAGSFDPAVPGRGAAKTGPGRIRGFQSGYAGGWTSDIPEPASVSIEELAFGIPQVWEPPRDSAADAAKAAAAEGPTDIQRIVSNVRAAAARAELPTPRKPWLPVLADSYDFSKLPNRRTDSELVLGVVDDAASQSQPTVAFNPDRDGNMAIIGTGGTGKSTALRTIAVSAAVTMRGGPTHIYGLDFGSGGLQMLRALPHVGAVISGDDEERVARLLRWLRDLVDQRSVKYGEARAGTITDYRRIAKAPDEPRIVLLLDGIAAFRETYENSVISPWFSVFSQIATDGRQVGVHVVVTGDRPAAVPSSLSSSIQRRVVLRLANQDDYAMLGVPNDVLGPASPPGRGILDELEVQIAVLGGDPNVAVQARQIEELAASMIKAGASAAPGVERLADVIPLDDLTTGVDGEVALGVADDNLSPIGVQPVGSFVISGPPGSGKTVALGTLATALKAARPNVELYLLSARRSPLSSLRIWKSAADSVADAEALIGKLQAQVASAKSQPGSIALFIERLSEFTGTSAEFALEPLIKAALKHDDFVVAESETSTWSQAYTLGQPLRAGRKGLIVQPDEGDGDVLLNTGIGRVRRSTFPPGRGFLIGQGRARKLQVATTESAG
jgi:S-DNA-T family DNA segregation ATPase FtsK/SpoIIIE